MTTSSLITLKKEEFQFCIILVVFWYGRSAAMLVQLNMIQRLGTNLKTKL